MYNSINNIYKVQYLWNDFAYAGCLINEKRFNIDDQVFFSTNGHKIARGKIVGIKKIFYANNPEYLYEVEIPEEFISMSDPYYKDKKLSDIEISCKDIFFSLEEAKESAIKNLNSMAKLQMEQIEKYFKQFE